MQETANTGPNCFFLKNRFFFCGGKKLCKVAPLGPVNEKQQCEIFAPSILCAEAAYYIFSFKSWRFLRSLPSSWKLALSSEHLSLSLSQAACRVTCLSDRFRAFHVFVEPCPDLYSPSVSSSPMFHKFQRGFFFFFFTMCHTGSWGPFNKGGSRPLWGFGNKRFPCVPHERASHFSEHNTA